MCVAVLFPHFKCGLHCHQPVGSHVDLPFPPLSARGSRCCVVCCGGIGGGTRAVLDQRLNEFRVHCPCQRRLQATLQNARHDPACNKQHHALGLANFPSHLEESTASRPCPVRSVAQLHPCSHLCRCRTFWGAYFTSPAHGTRRKHWALNGHAHAAAPGRQGS